MPTEFGIPALPNAPTVSREGQAPTVFMQALRPHTYHGRPQNGPEDDRDGDVYLAHEDEVENIENLKFARRIPPPPTAVRPPDAIPVTSPAVITEPEPIVAPRSRRQRKRDA